VIVQGARFSKGSNLTTMFSCGVYQCRSKRHHEAYFSLVDVETERSIQDMSLSTPVQTLSHSEKLAVKFPLHTILLQRNQHFFGRETILDELKHAVNQAPARSRPTVCAVNGIGGLGKTQTVLEFCIQTVGAENF
jgi:hypothetical protein